MDHQHKGSIRITRGLAMVVLVNRILLYRVLTEVGGERYQLCKGGPVICIQKANQSIEQDPRAPNR